MLLSIQVPSKFFYEWLEEHYVKILKVSLNKRTRRKRQTGLHYKNGKHLWQQTTFY